MGQWGTLSCGGLRGGRGLLGREGWFAVGTNADHGGSVRPSLLTTVRTYGGTSDKGHSEYRTPSNAKRTTSL